MHPALSLRDGGNDIVRRHRRPDPLQLELADWLDLHGVTDLCQYPRTNEDLSWLGLIAKPGGDVRNGPDGGIVKSALEADSPKRSKPVRDADAEANVSCPQRRHVSVKAPMASRTSSAMSDGLERRVLDWHRIIEDHHHAVTSVSF